MKTLKNSYSIRVLLCCLLVFFLMSAGAAYGAISYELDDTGWNGAYTSDASRLEAAGKFFWYDSDAQIIYCASGENEAGKAIAKNPDVSRYMLLSKVLTNGDKVFYTLKNLDTEKTTIYSVSSSGKSKVRYKTISTKGYDLHLQGVYNGRLYYTVDSAGSGLFTEKLYSLLLKTNKITRHSSDFMSKFSSGGSRYIYGYSVGLMQMTVFDCKNKTFRAMGLNTDRAVTSEGKLYYIKVEKNDEGVSVNVYKSALSGKGSQERIFTGGDVSVGKISASKIYYYSYDPTDHQPRYFYYDVKSKTEHEISSKEYK